MAIKILVPVKRVVDPNVRVRVNAGGSIDTTGLKMSLNPFDECALEKALQLRETGVAERVTVITCGLPVSQDVLRTALAMGADDAILIDTADARPAVSRTHPACAHGREPLRAGAVRQAGNRRRHRGRSRDARGSARLAAGARCEHARCNG